MATRNNTTRTMSHHTREYVALKPSRKRKEIEGGFDAHVKIKSAPLNPCDTRTDKDNKIGTPAADNKLLAGYLAHEFLTHGTLFGKKWDPTRAEAVPLSAARKNEKKVATPVAEPKGKHPCYDDVAMLLKSGRVYIPGIVNPTELGQWLHQM